MLGPEVTSSLDSRMRTNPRSGAADQPIAASVCEADGPEEPIAGVCAGYHPPIAAALTDSVVCKGPSVAAPADQPIAAQCSAAEPEEPIAGALVDQPIAGALVDQPIAGALVDQPIAGALSDSAEGAAPCAGVRGSEGTEPGVTESGGSDARARRGGGSVAVLSLSECVTMMGFSGRTAEERYPWDELVSTGS